MLFQRVLYGLLTFMVFVASCSKTNSQAHYDKNTEDTAMGTQNHSDSGAAEVKSDSVDNSTESQSVSDTATTGTQSCTQPEHVANCADKWCRVEPGCFHFGSVPEVDFCKKNERHDDPFDVTLTRAFNIFQHEVTQAEWWAAGLPGDFAAMPCDNCPAYVSWYEALVYCNKLSQDAGLETCYDLSCCEGRVGVPDAEKESYSEFHCRCEVEKYAIPYDCRGYRLPTTAEWEYAARAGTITLTYNGDFDPSTATSPTAIDPVIDEIAWYLPNSDRLPHPVEQKKPNNLGLYDMLGNTFEWCSDKARNMPLDFTSGQAPPLVDPFNVVDSQTRTARGGHFGFEACVNRAAMALGLPPDEQGVGFRPVRTLFEER